MGTEQPALRHGLFEDAQALVTGTLFVSLGIVMFSHVGLLTGGTAGVAFLIHYATGWNFGLAFFLINLPFYGLAWKRMPRQQPYQRRGGRTGRGVLADAHA